MSFIYKITNKVNNKIYVGQTTESLKQRFSRHMGYQKDEIDSKFYRAVRKYGVENFYIEALEELTDDSLLNEREEFWIRELDTVETGYNSYYGGFARGGDTLSNHPDLDNIKKKISDSKLGGKNPNARKILCKNIIDNTETIYDSMMDCSRDLKIVRSVISKRCLKEIDNDTLPYKKTYKFYYYDEYIKESQETIESVDNEKDIIE